MDEEEQPIVHESHQMRNIGDVPDSNIAMCNRCLACPCHNPAVLAELCEKVRLEEAE